MGIRDVTKNLFPGFPCLMTSLQARRGKEVLTWRSLKQQHKEAPLGASSFIASGGMGDEASLFGMYLLHALPCKTAVSLHLKGYPGHPAFQGKKKLSAPLGYHRPNRTISRDINTTTDQETGYIWSGCSTPTTPLLMHSP